MTRPPLQPRREDVAVQELDAYDAVITRVPTRLGRPAAAPEEHFDAGPYFGVMLTSPTLCHLASQMGAYLVTRGNVPARLLPFGPGVRRTGAVRRLEDPMLDPNARIPDAVGAGVRLEAIRALRDGDEAGRAERG